MPRTDHSRLLLRALPALLGAFALVAGGLLLAGRAEAVAVPTQAPQSGNWYWQDLPDAAAGMLAPAVSGAVEQAQGQPGVAYLHVSGVSTSSSVLVVVGAARVDLMLPMGGGIQVPRADAVLVSQQTADTQGNLMIRLDVPADMPSGLDLYFQVFNVAKAGDEYLLYASNGLIGTLP
jgi:hypothetical protein